MATVQAPVARVPFAPLDNPRLQHLASAKNRQNGLISQKSTASALNSKLNNTSTFPSINKPFLSTSPSVGKRAFEPSTFDGSDSENVDPAMFDSPPKKSKSETFSTAKPFTFTLTPQKSMSSPSGPPSRLLSTPARSNISSPRAPLTAPAGRSPRRKTAGIGKNRRVSAPFTRIDPPTFRGSTIPFSLDAALSGTFSSASFAKTAEPKSSGATIQESMPKGWFFDIYEDTPEEEAANLMEHSTLTLDLSSDEESDKKEKCERGKENTPPEGYDAPMASRGQGVEVVPKQVKKTEIVRQKICGEEMDDGLRSPLSDLETDPFIPEGLEKSACVVVFEEEVELAKEVTVLPVPALAAPVPAVDNEAEQRDEIVVWDDSATPAVVAEAAAEA